MKLKKVFLLSAIVFFVYSLVAHASTIQMYSPVQVSIFDDQACDGLMDLVVQDAVPYFQYDHAIYQNGYYHGDQSGAVASFQGNDSTSAYWEVYSDAWDYYYLGTSYSHGFGTCSAGSYEDNDTLGQAYHLNSGFQTIVSFMEDSADVDYFKYKADYTGVHIFDLWPPSSRYGTINFHYDILDANGHFLDSPFFL